MEAIVLAGGLGTRLRQVLPDAPKPMAPIAGRPFLEILLSALAQKQFHRVVLSVGYMADRISSHFGPRFAGMDLVYEVESNPLGTGGAICQASRRCIEDHYFVFNGDSYLELEVAKVEELWQTQRAPVIVARKVPDTQRYGRLETRQGRVTGFTAKGVSGPGLINGGCYVFGKQEFLEIPLGQPFSIEADYFPAQIPIRTFNCFVTEGLFIDIGIPEDLARAQVMLAHV